MLTCLYACWQSPQTLCPFRWEIIIFFSCGLFYDTQKTCRKLTKQKKCARENWKMPYICEDVWSIRLLNTSDSCETLNSAIYKFPVGILQTDWGKCSQFSVQHSIDILRHNCCSADCRCVRACDTSVNLFTENVRRIIPTSLETIFPNESAPTNTLGNRNESINAVARRKSTKVSRFTWTSADAVFHRENVWERKSSLNSIKYFVQKASLNIYLPVEKNKIGKEKCCEIGS